MERIINDLIDVKGSEKYFTLKTHGPSSQIPLQWKMKTSRRIKTSHSLIYTDVHMQCEIYEKVSCEENENYICVVYIYIMCMPACMCVFVHKCAHTHTQSWTPKV